MPRYGRVSKRKIQPDSVYGSELISRFIGKIIEGGKKSKAESIIYGALKEAKAKLNKEPLEIFETALKNIIPMMEVKSRRVGGATYQVPIEVSAERGQALAFGWLKLAAQERSGKSMIEKLSAEILDAYNNTGGAKKKQDDTHKTAEANKAFAHFRW
ncbi:MAG: small subunit ribosomal protein S7 [Candidatus Saganbacteria bacterium]|uniref:Small ribosomal subunit protein uS7 n=1 Tax=Candidatus Saganbacteria bacterium TaxID=2575572 RepID=A0A833L1A8_UNCSA|nr:MAG: small subunit ribosomal protein S7 [Candidatus Saganbacteria bacterium]